MESLEAMLDEPSRAFLWFWSLWECAEYCVQAKLKTPLGKANDTFQAFENAIRRGAAGLALQDSTQSTTTTNDVDSSPLTRLTLLVHFVESLEKLVYNAHEGTAVCLQPAGKFVKLFFRTNKSTCNEWFWRVRVHLVAACMRAAHYELVIQHASEFIHHALAQSVAASTATTASTPSTATNPSTATSNSSSSSNVELFDQVVVMLAKALVRVRSPATLVGLAKCLTQRTRRDYDWLRVACATEAHGRIELAAHEYRRLATVVDTSMAMTSARRFAAERLFDCYFQVRDWHEYVRWHDEYTSLLRRTGELAAVVDEQQQLLLSRVDLGLIKALGSFDAGRTDEARAHLVKLADRQHSRPSLARTPFSYEDTEWLTLTELLKTHIDGSASSTPPSSLLATARGLNVDEASAYSHDRLVLATLSQLATTISHQQQQGQLNPQPAYVKCLKLDANKHTASSTRYLNHFRIMLLGTGANESKQQQQLEFVRVARKQDNVHMATRILVEHMRKLSDDSADDDDEDEARELTMTTTAAAMRERVIGLVKHLTTSSRRRASVTTLALVRVEAEAAKLVKKLGSSSSSSSSSDSLAEAMAVLSASLSRVAPAIITNRLHLLEQQQQQQQHQHLTPTSMRKATATRTLELDELMCRQAHARSVLTLAKWLQASPGHLRHLNSLYVDTRRHMHTQQQQQQQQIFEFQDTPAATSANDNNAIRAIASELSTVLDRTSYPTTTRFILTNGKPN